MQASDLIGNGVFFVLDLLLIVILIPVVLKLRNRGKINHLTRLTLTAVNELMEIGGSTLVKFNQVAFGSYQQLERIWQMKESEREAVGLSEQRIKEVVQENISWLEQYTLVFEKEVNAFRSTIELFSPHFEDADILVFISKLNQNSRYALGSMEAIVVSFKLGGKIPNDVFGSINQSYKKMYDDVLAYRDKKKQTELENPKSLEKLYRLIEEGEAKMQAE
ncbi:hypothetical protein [Sunxiuqinia elliptica]|uniref:Uncharacterized protein n=1 Tax=Sunxiuqinia elliptica TaxID=655355 RepID=A0A1I2BXH7_9BACT|nr:hypothetical protein [Sunxiuqinia elliptica]SFE60819.1 hypothetical protein SAMN05216283_101540 [Sunxiuqinia elliptica]